MIRCLHKSILALLVLLSYHSNAQVVISTYVGTPQNPAFAGDDGPANAAYLASPSDIAVDGIGNLYIADFMNNAIRKVDTFGTIRTIAGSGNPTGGFSGDNGPATAAILNGPFALAIDKTGNVIFADGYNHVVRKINASTGIITTIAGMHTTAGYGGDNGPATDAKLNNPVGIALDTAGNIYIADDHNNVIRKVNTAGIISTFAGHVTAGYAGNGGPATDALINTPIGVAVDHQGNVYIADAANNAVRKVDTAGIMTTYAGAADTAHGYSGDSGPAVGARLYYPTRMVFDNDDNMYLSDSYNSVIRKVTPEGSIYAFAGTGVPGFSGDGGTPDTATMNATYGATIDQKGVFYIVDRGNHVIRRIGPPIVSDGVNTMSNKTSALSVYPNPVREKRINVNINSNVTENVLLTITNVLGQTVTQQTINTNGQTSVKMDVPAGLYFISAISGHGNWKTEVVVE